MLCAAMHRFIFGYYICCCKTDGSAVCGREINTNFILRVLDLSCLWYCPFRMHIAPYTWFNEWGVLGSQSDLLWQRLL